MDASCKKWGLTRAASRLSIDHTSQRETQFGSSAGETLHMIRLHEARLALGKIQGCVS
jgi:hypothetical protein